jgi:hypothetical protein
VFYEWLCIFAGFMKTLCFIQLQLAAVFLIVKGLTFHME